MKKLLVVLLLLTSVFTLASCKKDKDDDNEAPVITGDATLSIEVGEGAPSWLDLITAMDAEDGAIVLDATNVNLDDVDISTEGTFDVVYTVKDSAGKETTFTITVTVTESITPMISNPTDIYATIGDITITRGEMWDQMIKSYGLVMMQRYVEEILFEDYINALTEEEILDAKEFLIFGTNDEDLIAKMMEDDTFYNGAITVFEEALLFSGYNPDIAADVRAYLQLDLAKAAYTEEFLYNATEDDGFYISDTQLESFYDETTKGNVCAVSVEFASNSEFDSVLEVFNLVDNYNYGLGAYFGTEPIANLSSDLFDETNTTQLTDEAAFAKFILVYNYMNPNNVVPEDVTEADFCANYTEISEFDYMDLMEDVYSSTHPMTLYTTLMFDTLQIDKEGTSRFTYTNQNISGYHKFVYKVSQEEVSSFDDLSAVEKQELKDKFISLMTVSDVILSVTGDYILENELKLYDPTFRMIYEFENGIEVDVLNSETIMATYGDIEITADELFDYMEARLGISITTTLYETKLLLNSEFYTAKFGTGSIEDSTNENILDYYTQLGEITTNFYSGAYIQYGFDPANLSLREFLFLGFGQYTDIEVVQNVFILPNLQVDLAIDNMPSYDDILTHFELEYEEYFSMTVSHILMYLDKDNDFAPDDYSDFLEELSPEEVTELNGLKVLLEDLLTERLDAEKTFKEIQTEYNNSLIGDETNPWAPLKAYGFKIKQEDLQTLNNSNVDYYDDDFVVSLVELNETLNRPENEEVNEIFDTKLTTTAFGLHLIKAAKSGQFAKPSAMFEEADPLAPVYSIGSENENDILSESQIALYNIINLPSLPGVTITDTLPPAISTTIIVFYKPLFDQFISAWATSIVEIDGILASNPEFATGTAEKIAILQGQYENLIEQSTLRTE